MQALLNYHLNKCKACTDMQSVLSQFWKQTWLIKMPQVMQKLSLVFMHNTNVTNVTLSGQKEDNSIFYF